MRRLLLALPVMVALLAGVGVVPAQAAVPPEEEAWIRGTGLPVRNWELLGPFNDTWGRTVTVTSDGAVAGRAGNRHTATFSYRDGYRRFPILWSLRLTDEQCTGATCTTVWAGESDTLPLTDADLGPVAADGAVHVSMPLRGSSFRTTAPEGAPVPFGTSSLDVTVTPVGWTDPRIAPDLAGLPAVTRIAGTTSSKVQAGVSYNGDRVTVSGVIAGVTADEPVSGSWYDGGLGSADVGEPLPRLTTAAQLREYAPPVRNGRFTGRSRYDVYYEGIARGALTTTTGVRLRGDTFRISFNPGIEPAPGSPLAGQTDGNVSIARLDCPTATTPLDDCPAVETPEQVVADTGRLRYVLTPLGAVGLQIDLPVTNGTTGKSLGAVRVLAAFTPTGAGLPERYGSISGGNWAAYRLLQRTLTGQFRVGDLVSTPDFSSPNTPDPLTVRMTSFREGS